MKKGGNILRKYKAIFFDWDGTAVLSRRAPVDEVVVPMKKLLLQGVKLVIVSGTTIENIAKGKLHEYFTAEELKNLYLGLGRGAFNYAYDEKGQPFLLSHRIPGKEELLKIHRACYEIHEILLEDYDFRTDIVFSRPNYCKIDLMVENNRGDNLFFQENELEVLKKSLKDHGFEDGLIGLVKLAEETAKRHGMNLFATTDAKYLEVGLSSKSDNVDLILGHLSEKGGIQAKDCTFWGDEYIGLDKGLFGSDSFMRTEKTKEGDFFDVSDAKGIRPESVTALGGGVGTFVQFLETQSGM